MTVIDDMINKSYPSVAQSFVLTGIMMAAMLLFTPVMMLGDFMDREALGFAYQVLAVGTPCWIAYAIRKRKTSRTTFNLAIRNRRIVPLIVVATVALLLGVIGPISSLIPIPDTMIQAIIENFNQSGMFTFATMVIAAPILEEVLFRGIILDGLLSRYSPAKSILVSSVLFGIVHLDPWQFVAGMLMGVFTGWVYYRSRSLLAAILIHGSANLTGFSYRYFVDAESMMNESAADSFGGMLNYGMFIVGLTLVLMICIHLLSREFAKTKEFAV